MEADDLMHRLPEDMLAAVLRRLPPHGLAAARCVRKSWHAAVDAHRLLDLFPPSLAGLFMDYNELYISEFFSRPKRDAHPSVSGRLDYAARSENDDDYDDHDTQIMDHCNGLLLFGAYVANPATRRWAPLPPPPPGFGSHRIVFDPAVSPHYEVLRIPWHPWRGTTGADLQSEWPPSPFRMHVFSSTTGDWEERSFARRGRAIGTVARLQQRQNSSIMINHSAYWQGQLYVLNKFVMRISLSDCTYQAFEPPVDAGTMDQAYRLGRSENGVYFASIDRECRLRVWVLNKSRGEIDWVLKHDNSLDHMVSRGRYDPQVRGPWIMEDINYNSDHPTSPINKEEAATEEEGEDAFEWDSDNENTLDTTLEDGKRYTTEISILGFHPYKEVIFLNEYVRRGLAYHLNSSKLEDLGNIYPKGYAFLHMCVDQAFPYTPCWIGKLPGSR